MEQGIERGKVNGEKSIENGKAGTISTKASRKKWKQLRRGTYGVGRKSYLQPSWAL